MEFVAIDFETANERRDSACSVGLTRVREGQVESSVSWLIRPRDLRVAPINKRIHGISEDDLKPHPEFDVIWPKMREFIGDSCLVAHNASFDMSVLRRTLDLYSLPWPDLNYHCTRVVAMSVWPGLMSYSLDVISAHLGIEFTHHDAQEDSLACAKVLLEAANLTGATCIDEFCAKSDTSLGRLYYSTWEPPHGRYIQLPKRDQTPLSALCATASDFDADHPFFDKAVTFTGTLMSMTRHDAAQSVVNMGGRCADGVTKATNFLVLGIQDFAQLRAGHTKSSKILKAEKLIAEGHQLEIISEDEFLKML